MKNYITLIILAFTLSCFSQRQVEIANNASKEYKRAGAQLNKVYQQILSEYKSDTVFINRFKKAQRIWISFRDAELEMKFPVENKQLKYGDVYTTCKPLFLKKLTEIRIKTLQLWLNGIEEGDTCSGSVKMK